MHDLGLLIFHAGDQLVGSIVWLIVAFIALILFPFGLLFLLAIILGSKADAIKSKEKVGK